MATVIDSLLVSLGLDSSKFSKGQKEAVDQLKKLGDLSDKTNKAMEAASKATEDSFRKVAVQIAAVGTALVGAKDFTSWLTGTITSTAALGRSSQLLGMSARDLDAWGAAAKTVGGTAEGFAASMQSIEGGLAAFRLGKGGENIVTALAQLGVQSKNGTVNLDELSAALVRLKNTQGIQAAMTLAQQLGLDQGTFQLLLQGPEAINNVVDAMRRSSGVTQQNIEDAQKLIASWESMKQSASGLGQRVLTAILPAFEAATGAMIRFFDTAREKGLGEALGLNDPGAGGAIGRASRATGNPLGGKSAGWYDMLGAAATKAMAAMGDPEAQAAWDAMHPKSKTSAGASLSALDKQYGLPPGTLDSIWAIESARGKNAGTSSAGAKGPFQFMPGTGKQYGLNSDADLNDFGKSSNAAGRYLHDLMAKYHDINKAVAAYNEGPANLDARGMQNLPAQTQAYLSKFNQLQGARAGATGGSVSVETSINTINVNAPHATDADGIAKGIHQAINDNALIGAGIAGAR